MTPAAACTPRAETASRACDSSLHRAQYRSVRRTRSSRADYDRRVSDRRPRRRGPHTGLAGRGGRRKARSGGRSARVAERVREADATLWGPPGTAEIADRLGWLTIAERMLGEARRADAHSPTACATTGCATSCCSAWAARRWRRRCCGARSARSRGARACTCSTRPTRRPCARCRRPSTSSARCSSSPRSRAARSSRCRCSPTSGRSSATGQNFVAITDPARAWRSSRTSTASGSVFAGDPNIGGRYSALSPFGIVPAALIGVDIRGAAGGRERRIGYAAARRAPDAGSAPDGDAEPAARLARRRAQRARAGRARQADVRHRRVAAGPRAVARAARRRVHGQALDGHPAGRRGAAGRARRNTARIACSPTCPTCARPTPSSTRASRGWPMRGIRCCTIPTRGPGDLGRVFMLAELAVAVAGWGLEINPFDQPNVQQAKDATKQVLAEYEAEHELPEPPRPTTPRCARCSRAPRRRRTWRSWATSSRRTSSTRAIAELRAAIRARRQGDDDVRLRPALPALDRPVPQGRPAERALPAAAARRTAGRRDPGRRLHVHDAQERPGDRRPATRCASSGCRPSACACAARTPSARCAT